MQRRWTTEACSPFVKGGTNLSTPPSDCRVSPHVSRRLKLDARLQMSGMTEVGNDARDTMSDMKRKRDPGQESSTAFQNLLTKFPLRLPTTLLNSGHRFHLHAGKSDGHDWRF
jgi:hypothetical protein